MSDLCLLAASLLVQKQIANDQSPLPSIAPSAETTPATSTDECTSTTTTLISHTELHSPEFSPLKSNQVDRESQQIPVGANHRSSQLDQSNTLAQALPATRTLAPAAQRRTLPTRPQSAATQHRTVSRSTIPLPSPVLPSLDRFAPSPDMVLPVSQPISRPISQPVPRPISQPVLQTPVAAVDPISLGTPRPASGSQLYQQRIAALRAGRLYTRLPANSFQDQWINATRQPTYEEWVSLLSQEAGAMARGQGSNRLTILLGDSLSLWYPTEQLSSDRFWLNQGISGDTTTGVLRRLAAFSQTRPDTIHIMLGINDLRRGASDAEVINNLRQIMQTLRHQHPQAQIFVHSILPTRLPSISSGRIHRINHSLSYIAKQEQVNFLELGTYFSDEYGNLRRDLTTDGLHLNSRGYAMWQWALRSHNLA
jgi:lysophospholipase L1-like esterase